MKKLLLLFLTSLMLFSCTSESTIPVYVWTSFGKRIQNDSLLREEFKKLQSHGVKGVCVNFGWNKDAIEKISKMAHEFGMEYHAWISTVVSGDQDSTWYTVNRLGESAYDKPVYVSYYKTLDPHNPAVIDYLCEKCAELAEIPSLDYVQLDYVRYADVILARGLWDKYGLVMDEEYPNADYCYCDECVADFKAKTGIDIREVEDPSKCEEWAKFRCDNVTNLVNKIAEVVHAKGKKLSADVFPGPNSYAKWMVRQQWDEWDIDAVFPMNYNDFYLEPASWVGKITKEEAESLKGKNIDLYSGLFICRRWKDKASIEDPEGHGLVPSEIAQTVKDAMASGAKGICLFTSGSMTDEHWAELDKTTGVTK